MTLPRTTPEQRGRLYEDTETLISPGFLTHPVSISETQFAIRTLNPSDLFLLRARVGNGTDTQWRDWAIATSIWVLDGYVLLGESHAVPKLYKTIRSLPKPTRELLFSLILGLFNRQGKAIKAAEAFCYEGVSRYRWKACGGRLKSPGLPGGLSLGTNYIQDMWTAFNVAEDLRQQDESMWEGFKLMTSAQSPKGIKKIDEADKRRRETEEKRRQEAMDRFYYLRMGVIQEDGKAKGDSSGQPIVGIKTSDDLAEEMKRWVTGEEDWHDRVVTEYKQRISNEYAQSKAEQVMRQAMMDKLRDSREGQATTSLIGYTPGQLQEMLRGRGEGASGVRWVSENQNAPREYLYEKYIEKPPEPGKLVATAEGKLLEAEPLNLTEQVEARKVLFHTEPGVED